jgi:ribosomal protein S18 acetylase RimI-like enzyme
MADIRLLTSTDASVLEYVAPGVFDHPVDSAAVAEFLADFRHHICVAIENGAVVGFASAVHYVHPDKPTPQLWINEVGVGPAFRRLGLAKAILHKLLAHAKSLGCKEAWVLTDEANVPARALYSSAGGDERPLQLMVDFDLARLRTE